jgi:branched-chain amino acid transport system substrate-binding protein
VQKSEVTDPYAFPIGGGIFTEYPAQSLYAVQNLKASNGVAIISDNGSAEIAANLYKGPWDRAGKNFHAVVVPVTSADLSPSVAKALSYHPDAIMVTLVPAQATQLYQALARQGYDMSKVINQGPSADEQNFFGKVTPRSILEGTNYSSQYSSYDDTSGPETAIYRHAMQTYENSDGRAEFYVFGFAPLMTDYLVAKTMGFDKFDASTLKTAFETQKLPIFMSYQYDRSTAPKDLSQAGSPYFRLLQYRGGKLTNTSDGFLNATTGETVKPGASPFASFPGA